MTGSMCKIELQGPSVRARLVLLLLHVARSLPWKCHLCCHRHHMKYWSYHTVALNAIFKSWLIWQVKSGIVSLTWSLCGRLLVSLNTFPVFIKHILFLWIVGLRLLCLLVFWDFSVSYGLVYVNSPLRTWTLLCLIFLPGICVFLHFINSGLKF